MSSTASKKYIILVPESSILNPKKIIPYQNLSTNYSVYLNTLLFSNWLDVIPGKNDQFEVFTMLNSMDLEFMPKYFLPDETHTLMYEGAHLSKLAEYLSKLPIKANSKLLILFFNGIGLKSEEINRIFNLVQSDEPSMVIGKSNRDKLIFTCSSFEDYKLIDAIFNSNRNYSEYLNQISDKDIFIHTLDGYLSIDDFEDIKKLYIELSKKESLSFCSKKMHESFNDLFIEYKELLND